VDINGTTLPVPLGPGPPTTTGRDLVPVTPPPDVAPTTKAIAAEPSELTHATDVRAASPREIVNLSLDLYAEGIIGYDDYAVLAFQPELHPDYNKTVGALTGEPAQPDQRRDYVQVWEDQLQFELRHGAGDSAVVRQTNRIRDMLKQLVEPTRIEA